MSQTKLDAPKWLKLEQLEENTGQIEGLPANPRDIRDEKYELLKQNIQNYPEFLRYNSLKVLPLPAQEGKYIILGGNMRFRALKELGYEEVPCVIIPADTPIDKLKAYVVLDNSPFGQWDWMMLQGEDWNADELQSWGVEMPIMETEIDPDEFFDNLTDDEIKGKTEHITITLPEDLKEQKEEIKSLIKEALSKYNGISYK